MVRDRARFYPAGPACQRRDANSAFVQVTFDAAQRAVAIVEVRVVSALAVRAVVTGEHHQRMFVDAKLLELRKQFADVTIHPRNHRSVAFLRLRPVLVGIRFERGHLHPFLAGFIVGVWDGEGQVQEKGPIFFALNERQCFFGT